MKSIISTIKGQGYVLSNTLAIADDWDAAVGKNDANFFLHGSQILIDAICHI